MQTREDELTSDRHLKMSFIEFLEGVARAASYLSLPPPTSESKFEFLKKGNTKNLEEEEKLPTENNEHKEEVFLTEEE